MRRHARLAGAVFLTGALTLALGAGSPKSASSSALSFTSRTGVVTDPSSAAVIVDRSTGTFLMRRRGVPGPPEVAVADAVGDLNGDGRLDLVTHVNEDEEGDCSEVEGVEVCTAYVYVSFARKNGTFRAPHRIWESDYFDVAAVAVGDVNGDGKADVELATVDSYDAGSGLVTVLLGVGKGKFRPLRYDPRDLRTRGVPVAIEAVDLNGDGRRDVVTANGSGTVSVFVNRGGGSLARHNYRVGPHPAALAIGDLNGDRRPDLAVSRSAGDTHAVTVLLNRGGSFGGRRSYATGTQPGSVAIGDLNGDGRPDLVTGNSDAGTASVLLNEGGGRFRAKLDYATGAFPFAVAVGRFDGDGRRDVVVPTFEERETVTVLVNTPGVCDVQDVWGLPQAAATEKLAAAGCGVGTVGHVASQGFAAGRIIGQSPDGGTVLQGGAVDLTVSDGPGPGAIAGAPSYRQAVSYPIPQGGQQVAVADVNGDGAADVVSASCGHSVSVLLNRGNGTLAPRQDYRVNECPDTLAVTDLNGDGRPDVVTGGDDGTISVLLNNGDGTFAARHDYAVGNGPTYGTDDVAVGDLNGDGSPDLASGNGFESEAGISVLLNNGDGTFTTRDYPQFRSADAIAIGDVTGDGRPDLVADELGDTMVIVNDGDGAFSQGQLLPEAGEVSDVFVGDVTADGNADVIVTNGDSDTVEIFLNNGTGLRPYAAYKASRDLGWVAIGDANGDGTQDLVTAGKSLSILRNRGDGTFFGKRGYATGTRPPRGVALGDLNGDGKPDLVTANGRTAVVRLAR